MLIRVKKLVSTFAIVAVAWMTQIVHAQIDDQCTVSVNGQSADVNADGSFLISNVPSGPNLVRVEGVCFRPGYTLYGTSEFYEVVDGQTFTIAELPLWPFPPRSLVRSRVSCPLEIFDMAGQTAPVTVLGEFSDGVEDEDITAPTEGSTYMSTNPAVLTVDEFGLVTAIGSGIGFVTVNNQGTASVTEVLVSLGIPTVIEGYVQLEDGSLVEGATVRIAGFAQIPSVLSDDQGFFEIPDVPTDLGVDYTVRATIVIGEEDFVGSAGDVVPIPGGLTDAGIIKLALGGGSDGPLILSGQDPEDHGFSRFGAAGLMLREMIPFLIDNSGIHIVPNHIAVFGGSVGNANALRSILEGLMDLEGNPYILTHVPDAQILTVELDPALTEFDVIYMPSTSPQGSGGLSSQGLANINARGDEIIEYLNSGGGIISFVQEGSGAYQWFLDGLQFQDFDDSRVEVTQEGRLFFSEEVVELIADVTPYHGVFSGPPGFFGLAPLVRQDLDPQQTDEGPPVILGGFVTVEK